MLDLDALVAMNGAMSPSVINTAGAGGFTGMQGLPTGETAIPMSGAVDAARPANFMDRFRAAPPYMQVQHGFHGVPPEVLARIRAHLHGQRPGVAQPQPMMGADGSAGGPNPDNEAALMKHNFMDSGLFSKLGSLFGRR